MAFTPEQPTPGLSVFDDAYATRTAPWVIGEPQPAIVTLERERWVRGKVLDVGCGTGEHTIYLSALGYDVDGLDSSPRAIKQARANAAARNVRGAIVRDEHAIALHRQIGEFVDLPAWLARARRI